MRGLLAWDEATALRAQWARERLRVVFTNGCFDILHAGHVHLLETARQAGDRLIVGLNDDASVRRLKGPQRPINTLADRATVLAALRAVDAVVPFSQDTPLELIRRLRPEVLVKGGDYTPDTIVGADEVRASGGQVLIVPLVAGKATTALIQTIIAQK